MLKNKSKDIPIIEVSPAHPTFILIKCLMKIIRYILQAYDCLSLQITHWQSPYMHAYFPALNSYPSLLGDMLADAIGCLGFTWVSHMSVKLYVIQMYSSPKYNIFYYYAFYFIYGYSIVKSPTYSYAFLFCLYGYNTHVQNTWT